MAFDGHSSPLAWTSPLPCGPGQGIHPPGELAFLDGIQRVSWTDPSGQRRSVKYLTCWYWQNGGCKKSEGDCLYSHYDTGVYAERPRPLTPGGKNAQVALHKHDMNITSPSTPYNTLMVRPFAGTTPSPLAWTSDTQGTAPLAPRYPHSVSSGPGADPFRDTGGRAFSSGFLGERPGFDYLGSDNRAQPQGTRSFSVPPLGTTHSYDKPVFDASPLSLAHQSFQNISNHHFHYQEYSTPANRHHPQFVTPDNHQQQFFTPDTQNQKSYHPINHCRENFTHIPNLWERVTPVNRHQEFFTPTNHQQVSFTTISHRQESFTSISRRQDSLTPNENNQEFLSAPSFSRRLTDHPFAASFRPEVCLPEHCYAPYRAADVPVHFTRNPWTPTRPEIPWNPGYLDKNTCSGPQLVSTRQRRLSVGANRPGRASPSLPNKWSKFKMDNEIHHLWQAAAIQDVAIQSCLQSIADIHAAMSELHSQSSPRVRSALLDTRQSLLAMHDDLRIQRHRAQQALEGHSSYAHVFPNESGKGPQGFGNGNALT